MNEELKIIISAVVDKFKKATDEAKKEIKSFKEQVEEAGKTVDKDFKEMGDNISKSLKVGAAAMAAAGAAVIALGASTTEYRKEQAKLATAFEAAGGSAAQATSVYNDLYTVLGDGGQATEAASHLAKLTTEEKALSEWTNICQGIYGTFGASLPIESLTEAANETAKTGALTGALADALNWAGVSEDAFQASLDACNSEAEREALIRNTLNGLYDDASKKFAKNNKEIIEQNKAQAKLEESTARVGKAVAPVIALFTELAADALSAVAPYLQDFAENLLPIIQELLVEVGEALEVAFTWVQEHSTLLAIIAGIIATVVTAIGLYNAVAAIKAAMDAAQVTTIWGLVSAHIAQAAAAMAAIAPYILIVAAIAAVIAIIVLCIKYWDDIVAAVKSAMTAIWNAIKTGVDWIKGIVDKIIGFVKDNWQGLLLLLVNPFAGAFKLIYDNCEGFREIVDNVCKAIAGFFSNLWENIKKTFSGVGSFFSGVFNKIKDIFSKVGTTIGNAVSGAFKNAINWVLEKAIGIINGFIGAINTAIGIINNIPGVKISQIKKLDVPKLEQGGVLKKGQVGLLEGNGAEAVVPLEKNTGWLDEIAKRLNGASGGVPIVLQVDGKTFAQIAVSTINDLTRQTGNMPLVIV